MKRVVLVSVCSVAIAATAAAQSPYPSGGQYPSGQDPNGQYPPGQMPGGGIHLPSWNKKKSKPADGSKQPDFTAEGRTVSNDGKTLVIATDDGRQITMSLTAHTKYSHAGADIASQEIVPRTTVHIEAIEDDQAYLTAASVNLLKAAPADRDEGPGGTGGEPDELAAPTILHPREAPGRPVLRHGKPSQTPDEEGASSEVASGTKPASGASGSSGGAGDFTIDAGSEQAHQAKPGEDPLIAKSQEWAETFTQGLPNYVCQQMTTRYLEQSKAAGWEAQDVVTAKVVYEDGKEDYKEITVGGRHTNKSMLELGGNVSTGEFASTLHSLLAPGTHAQFKRYESETVGGTPTMIFDFQVVLARSSWFISIGGQSLRPAYSGSVWIDKQTAEVRRIEMKANNIPKNFPLDTVEWAVDYESVSLGTAKFLLPVHAENLSCQRGSSICSKNETDFRDYHRYSGESTIEFK